MDLKIGTLDFEKKIIVLKWAIVSLKLNISKKPSDQYQSVAKCLWLLFSELLVERRCRLLKPQDLEGRGFTVTHEKDCTFFFYGGNLLANFHNRLKSLGLGGGFHLTYCFSYGCRFVRGFFRIFPIEILHPTDKIWLVLIICLATIIRYYHLVSLHEKNWDHYLLAAS